MGEKPGGRRPPDPDDLGIVLRPSPSAGATKGSPQPATATDPRPPAASKELGGRRRRRILPLVGGLAVAAVLVAVVVVLVLRGDDTKSLQLVVLERFDSSGDAPFTSSVVEPDSVAAQASVAGVRQAPTGVTTDRTGDTTTAMGTAPGLYGGTGEVSICDAKQLIGFLAQDPTKARAWASVLGLNANDIATFVRGLSPVILRTDTWVTNHGFRGGAPTSRQAVLQSGTAVMVDAEGVPRVKCSCGNPLTPPATDDADLSNASGDAWSGFDPTSTVNVTPGAPVNALTVWDVTDGQLYQQPVPDSDPGAIRRLDLRNMAYPADSCRVGTWAASPPIPVAEGRGVSLGSTPSGPADHAEITGVDLVGYADLDSDGADEAVVRLSCNAGGVYGDYIVVALTLDSGRVALLGGSNIAAVATEPEHLNLPDNFGGQRKSRIQDATLDGTTIVVSERYDATGRECNGCLSGEATIEWRFVDGRWRSALRPAPVTTQPTPSVTTSPPTSAPPTTESVPTSCSSISFSPSSEDGAFDIAATGVSCGDASQLIRAVAAQHNFSSGPRSFDIQGYSCSVVTSGDALPSGSYSCANGSKRVSWTKS